MESYELSGIVVILRECIKIFSKNGKLLALISTLTVLLYAAFFFSFSFSSKILTKDLLLQQALFQNFSSPDTFQTPTILRAIQKDVGILLGTELVFVAACFAVSLFSKTAIIILSVVSYGNGNGTSLKHLLLRIKMSWTRPFITSLYLTLLSMGYCLTIVFATLTVSLIVANNPIASLEILVVVLVLASILYYYLRIVWDLAFVVSVVEESSGIEALGKAAGIVKGRRLLGFILNLVFMAFCGVVSFFGYKINRISKSVAGHVVVFVLVISCVFLVKMFHVMAYTVLYFQCKKLHGEEVLEMEGGYTEYTKVPSTDVP